MLNLFNYDFDLEKDTKSEIADGVISVKINKGILNGCTFDSNGNVSTRKGLYIIGNVIKDIKNNKAIAIWKMMIYLFNNLILRGRIDPKKLNMSEEDKKKIIQASVVYQATLQIYKKCPSFKNTIEFYWNKKIMIFNHLGFGFTRCKILSPSTVSGKSYIFGSEPEAFRTTMSQALRDIIRNIIAKDRNYAPYLKELTDDAGVKAELAVAPQQIPGIDYTTQEEAEQEASAEVEDQRYKNDDLEISEDDVISKKAKQISVLLSAKEKLLKEINQLNKELESKKMRLNSVQTDLENLIR